MERLKKWIEIKKINISRMNLDWDNIPYENYSNENPDPVETDLNLTGKHSLSHLIDTSISRQGKSLLKNWMLNTNPNIEDINERQELVKELIPAVRLRDRLSLIGVMFKRKDFNGELLLDWLKNFKPQKNTGLYLIILSLLVPVNILLFVLTLTIQLPNYWLITLLIYIGIYYFGNSRKKEVFGQLELVSEELEKFKAVLRIIESYPYPPNSKIKKLCSCYWKQDYIPSILIDKMNRDVSFLRMRSGNPFVWTIFRIFFPVDYYYIRKVEKYNQNISGNLPDWLDTFYTLDALNSLAGFAYLNPGYEFPELKDNKNSNNKIFEAEKLGHPLIAEGKKVSNSFSFSPSCEIAVITGSNMSGKSTFLRTLGINLCLAYSGGPVNGENFRVSLFRIFTCIKVSDSVIDGISYFYAEVKRLKLLLEQINENSKMPVFFLIDEIFRGTNNVERYKGSAAFIKTISHSGSIGAVATHDLELVKLEQEISNLNNYHFKEQIDDNRMVFDYKIQPGPCPTTNALKIMKMEGLPVE